MDSETGSSTPEKKIAEKSDISKHLMSGAYKLSPRPLTSSSKSDVWNFFEEIIDDKSIIAAGYVACKKCKQVFKHDSKTTGTSSLKRHITVCNTRQSKKIHSYMVVQGKPVQFKPFKQEDKDLVTDDCVKFISKDLRSFNTVAGLGFTNFCQTLINIGAGRGSVDAKLLIPDRTTVARNTHKLASELRSKLIPELKDIYSSVGGAVTLDFWTDDYRKVSYLCITVHYITSKWNLVERVLCTSQWNIDLKKTGDNIKTMVINSLKEFGLDSYFNSIVYVTDRGTNIVAALKTVTRLSCTIHILNTILLTTFSRIKDTNILELIAAGKRLVMYFKQTGMQTKLKKTLKAPIETRWNSMYLMFDSISEGYEDIIRILEERDDINLLNDLPYNAVISMVSFLLKFYQASLDLQVSKNPTIHLVMVWYTKLTNHLELKEDDEEGIEALKKLCTEIFHEKFKCDMLHKVAALLHPDIKTLRRFCTVTEIAEVHTKVREMINDVKKVQVTDMTSMPSTSTASTDSGSQIAEQPRKKAKVSSIAEFADKPHDASNLDELQVYLDFIVQTLPVDVDRDIMDWWHTHSTFFPLLSKVARFVLAIPASSAPSERDFSLAGFVIQERRTQLHPSSVDDILFLHSNMTLE